MLEVKIEINQSMTAEAKALVLTYIEAKIRDALVDATREMDVTLKATITSERVFK